MSTVLTTGTSFTAAASAYGYLVECWGGGGSGWFTGGNGGNYSSLVLSCTPSQVFSYQIGQGAAGTNSPQNGTATWFGSTTTVYAGGGNGGGNGGSTTTNPNSQTSDVGTVKHLGGTAGYCATGGSTSQNSGGGSAATSANNGNNSANQTGSTGAGAGANAPSPSTATGGAAGPIGSGSGSNGGANVEGGAGGGTGYTAAGAGGAPGGGGGGGGGGATTFTNSGPGANGQIRLTQVLPATGAATFGSTSAAGTAQGKDAATATPTFGATTASGAAAQAVTPIAVTYSGGQSMTYAGGTQGYNSTAFNAGGASLLMIGLSWAYGNNPFNAVAYGGVAGTLVGHLQDSGNTSGFSVYAVLSPPTGSNTIAFTTPSGYDNGIAEVTIVGLSGTATSPIESVATANNVNSTTPSVTLSGVNGTTSYLLLFQSQFYQGSGAGAAAVHPGTLLVKNTTTTPSVTLAMAFGGTAANAGTNVLSYSETSNYPDTDLIAVEVLISGTSPVNAATGVSSFGLIAAGAAQGKNPVTATPNIGTTNFVRNSSMVGAAAGTPGTLPTNWTHVATSGLSYNVIGSGTESGLPYIDIQVTGTTTANAASVTITFDNVASKAIPGLRGQTWTASLYAKLISGTFPSFSQLYLYGFNSAATTGTESFSVNVLPTTAGLITQPFSRSAPLAVSTTTWLTLGYYAQAATSGTAVNFTIRLGAPQIEAHAGQTAFVPTTTVAATGDGLASSATATPANPATASATMGPAAAAGTAAAANPAYGEGDFALAAAGTAAGAVSNTAYGEGDFAVAAAGTAAGTDAATGAPLFGPTAAAGAASEANPATGAALFGPTAAAGVASDANPATGAALFGPMVAAGTASAADAATGTALFTTISAAGQVNDTATGAPSFGLISAGTASAANPATATPALGLIAAAAATEANPATAAPLFAPTSASAFVTQGSSAIGVATFGVTAAGIVNDTALGSSLFSLAAGGAAQAQNPATAAPVLSQPLAAGTASARDSATAAATFSPVTASGIVGTAAAGVATFGPLTASGLIAAGAYGAALFPQSLAAGTVSAVNPASAAPTVTGFGSTSFAQAIVAAAGGGILIPSAAGAASVANPLIGGGGFGALAGSAAASATDPVAAQGLFGGTQSTGAGGQANPAAGQLLFANPFVQGTAIAINATFGLGLFAPLQTVAMGGNFANGIGLFAPLTAQTLNGAFAAALFAGLSATGNAVSNVWRVPAPGGFIPYFQFPAKLAWEPTSYVFDLSAVLAPATAPAVLTNEYGFPLTVDGVNPITLTPGGGALASASITVTPPDVTVQSSLVGGNAVAAVLIDGVPWTQHTLTLTYSTVAGVSGSISAPLYVEGGPPATSPYLATERLYPINDELGRLLYWP